MSNIKFAQNFENYNFIIDHIFKFKTVQQFIRINGYIRSVVPTIQCQNAFKLKSVQYKTYSNLRT